MNSFWGDLNLSEFQTAILYLASRCRRFQIYWAHIVLTHHQFDVFLLVIIFIVILVLLTGSCWTARISRDTRTSSNNLSQITTMFSSCGLLKDNVTAAAPISLLLVSSRVCQVRMDLQDREECQGAMEQRSAWGAKLTLTNHIYIFFYLTLLKYLTFKLPLQQGIQTVWMLLKWIIHRILKEILNTTKIIKGSILSRLTHYSK